MSVNPIHDRPLCFEEPSPKRQKVEDPELLDGDWRKFLLNLWALEGGHFNINEYEGALSSFFRAKIADFCASTRHFACGKQLAELIKEANVPPKEKATNYLNGKAVLDFGDEEHPTNLIFYQKYCLISSKASFAIHQITDQKLINEALFNTTQILPIKKSPCNLTKSFNKRWKDPTANEISTTLAGYLALHKWITTKDKKGISEAFAEVNQLNAHFEFWAIGNYLDYCSTNPSRMDSSLLERIFEKAELEYTPETVTPFLASLKTRYQEIKKSS